jgi:hypothetical protein
MKTLDFASTLKAFAALAGDGADDDLRSLAEAFGSGKEETVAARVKKWSRATGYPARLKASLVAIQEGLTVSGAAKQAADIGFVLGVFAGAADTSTATFIAEITAPPPDKKRASPAPQKADDVLARKLADDLTRTVFDTDAFKEVVTYLRDKKQVNTPTLSIIANRFLGNDKSYTGRKEPLDDIVKRQKADAREHARGKALNRIGV